MPGRACAVDVAAFVARGEIATSLARHRRGGDRRDAALPAFAYGSGGEVAYGMFDGPSAAFADVSTGAMADAPPTLRHSSNMVIRVAGARTAETGGGWRDRLIGGRHLDRHEKREGRWHIAHRTYVPDWNMNGDSPEGGRTGPSPADEQIAATPIGRLGMAAGAWDAKEGDEMTPLDEVLAKQALHDLLVDCARGTDRGDATLIAGAFHPEADVVTGVLDAKAPEFAIGIVALVRENLRSCFHSIANEYFEVAGDKAVGESYVIAHQLSLGDAPTQTLTGGRYLDHFERRAGRWAIAGRRFIEDWTMTRPSSMELDGMHAPPGTRGAWGDDDPAVAFWNAWRKKA